MKWFKDIIHSINLHLKGMVDTCWMWMTKDNELWQSYMTLRLPSHLGIPAILVVNAFYNENLRKYSLTYVKWLLKCLKVPVTFAEWLFLSDPD